MQIWTGEWGMLIGLITLAIVVAFFLLERVRPELIARFEENFLAILWPPSHWYPSSR
jgi:hypothetical protein